MKTVKERLVHFLSTLPNKKGGLGVTKGAFQTKTGLKAGAIANMGASLHADTVKKIKAHYPNLNETWLLFGQGPMLIDNEKATGPHIIITDSTSKALVKLKTSYVQRLTSIYQRQQ